MHKISLCFEAAGAVLVVATVSAFVYVKNESSSMDGLFNANVEALADGESGNRKCFNSITTAEGQMVRYCGSCTYVDGKPTWGSGTGECK